MKLAASLEFFKPRPLREQERHAADLPACVRERGKRVQRIKVTDLSTRGCGFQTPRRLNAGEVAWLRLPGLESWEARVVWYEDDRGGLEFTRPLHPGVVARFVEPDETSSRFMNQ